jgi:predicted transcriptional regulator of viral defense system
MNDEEKVLELIKKNNGTIKTSDIVSQNINKMSLVRLVKKGLIERIERGLYIDSSKIEDSYFIFQYKCPKAIFSHETALYFHDLSDRTPIELMVTVPSGYNSRLLKNAEYRFSYIKEDLYELGKTTITTQYGNDVYCYDIERTICDIIRDKNKIEKYQFKDALKRYTELKVKDIAKLYKYAEKFNIKDEVKKYIEVLN